MVKSDVRCWCVRVRFLCALVGGYKGYGLGMMVDVLCGVMSGATFGPNVRIWKTRGRKADYVRYSTIIIRFEKFAFI